MCGDWNAADDLVQETLLILHRRWGDVEPSARRAYMWTVMSHLVTQEHGRARWQRESLRDVLPEPTLQPPEEETAIANRLAIKNALHCLSAPSC
jgi:DNA-directed RNA polymerase specialized sigma24 family protein